MHRASARTAALVLGVLVGGLATAGVVAAALPAAHGVLAYVSVGLLVVMTALGGSPLTTSVLRLADRAQRHTLDVSSPLTPATQSLSSPGLLRGGATLGVLERLATFATLAAAFPEGIAVVIAVKGLGRFTELKVAAAGERFMIGTLTSLLWAGACWAVAQAVLT